MSKSNSRTEARKCLSKAIGCDDSQDKWRWLVLAESWLLLAKTQVTAEKSFQAKKHEPVLAQGEMKAHYRGQGKVNPMRYREEYTYYEAGI